MEYFEFLSNQWEKKDSERGLLSRVCWSCSLSLYLYICIFIYRSTAHKSRLFCLYLLRYIWRRVWQTQKRAVVVHACAASWDGRAPKTGGWSLGVGEKNQGFLLFFKQFGFPADFPINSGTWIGLLKGLDLNLLAHLKWASTPAWFATLLLPGNST